MSEVFDGYERQYCELSAILSRQCTAASALDGGNDSLCLRWLIIFEIVIMKKKYIYMFGFVMVKIDFV